MHLLLLVLALNGSLVGHADGRSLIPTPVVLRTPTPDDADWRNIGFAFERLAQTETGKKTLSELGLQGADWSDPESVLTTAGVRVWKGKEMSQWAETLHRSDQAATSFTMIVQSEICLADPDILAPILVHELTHIKDRRDAHDAPEIMGPTEEHAYMRQVHAFMEIQRVGSIPRPNPDASPEQAMLLLEHLMLTNAWEGKSLPPNRFGEKLRDRVVHFNDEGKRNPGLTALLLYGDLQMMIGKGAGYWDLDRSESSEYVAAFRERMAQEDRDFIAWATKPQLVRVPDPEPPLPHAPPSESGPHRIGPAVVPTPRAVAVPVDMDEMRRDGERVRERLDAQLDEIKRFAADVCARPGLAGQSNTERFLKDCADIEGAWSGFGFHLPESAVEGLQGCPRQFLIEAVALRRTREPDSLDIDRLATRAAKANEPQPEPRMPVERLREDKPPPLTTPNWGPCGNLGSGCP